MPVNLELVDLPHLTVMVIVTLVHTVLVAQHLDHVHHVRLVLIHLQDLHLVQIVVLVPFQ